MINTLPTILIVDDEPTVRLLIRETLSAHPLLSFTEAEDGMQALDLAQAAGPDLILLDIMLPKLDGIAVCKAIKGNPKLATTYIAMVTALDNLQSLLDAMQAGADDYLTKPFGEQDLWAIVFQALRLDPPQPA
jgi:CheY-like chemotaxis protein